MQIFFLKTKIITSTSIYSPEFLTNVFISIFSLDVLNTTISQMASRSTPICPVRRVGDFISMTNILFLKFRRNVANICIILDSSCVPLQQQEINYFICPAWVTISRLLYCRFAQFPTKLQVQPTHPNRKTTYAITTYIASCITTTIYAYEGSTQQPWYHQAMA